MSLNWVTVATSKSSFLGGLVNNVVGGSVGSSVGDFIIALADGASIDEAISACPVWVRAVLTSEQVKPKLPFVLVLLEKGFLNVEEIRKWRAEKP